MSPDFGEFGKVPSKGIDARALEELGKIKPSQWKEMGIAFTAMADLAKAGGITQFMGGTVNAIKSRIENSVTGMFAPIINEFTQFISDMLVESEGMQALFDILLGIIKAWTTQSGIVLDEFGNKVDASQFTWQGLLEAWEDFWDDVLGTATPPMEVITPTLPIRPLPDDKGDKEFHDF